MLVRGRFSNRMESLLLKQAARLVIMISRAAY
jgi:hypothetical protein